MVEVCDITSVSCGQEINLVGRLLLADKTGNISKFGVFTRIKDRDFITFERVEWGGHSIPVFLLKNEENVLAANSLFHYGDVIMLRGAKEQLDGTDIFIATEVVLLSKTVGDVYDSNIDFRKRSNLHDHRHLQLIRDPGRVANFKKCSVVLRSIREFLYGQGYEELNLTMLQEKFEAGLAKPFTTRVNELDRDMYLRLTSELFLRKLMIAGFSKIFEIGKSFRNQGATGSMLPQFTILELYRSFATSEAVESLLQDMLCYVLVQLYGLPSIPTNGGVIDCAGDWPRYDFLDEIHRLTGLHYDESRPIAERLSLLDRLGVDSPSVVVNDYTVATALYSSVMSKITGPAFLRNLPAAQSPIFKLGDNKSVVDETNWLSTVCSSPIWLIRSEIQA